MGNDASYSYSTGKMVNSDTNGLVDRIKESLKNSSQSDQKQEEVKREKL